MTKTKILLSTALIGTLFAVPQMAAAQATPSADAPAPAAQQATPSANAPAPAAQQATPSANAPAPAAQQSEGIEDIIVTARRKEENLQRVPVAVTALSEQTLIAAKIENVADLQRTAPGLVIARGSAGTDGFAFVSIRGQGNLQPILANDPAVATYIDSVYVARPSVGLTDLQDIQRLEVLRGPQGTLFGRNTTGGALNIISNDPDQTFGGMIKGEAGNYADLALQATLNAPLTDKLAARVNYAFRKHGGYGEDPTLGGRPVGDTNNQFVRGKLKYDGDGFDITLSGDYNRTKNKGQRIALAAINPSFGTIGALGYTAGLTAALHSKAHWWDSYGAGTALTPASAAQPASVQALYGKPPFNELKVWGFGGIVNIDVGSLKLKSITGYRNSMNAGLSDTDASSVPLLATYAGSSSDYISEEVQLAGDITNGLSFISGVYASRENGLEYSRSQIFGGALRDSTAGVTNKTLGLFTQAYYQITSTVRATGGFRYTWDKRDSILHNAQILGLPYSAPVASTPTGINCTVTKPDQPVTATTCNQTQKANFQYPAWTAVLDWQATDSLFLYAKTSGAAKAGGWNLRAGGLPAFAPEKVKDVEVGLKSEFFDKRVRFNAAAFHTWKTNNQAIVNAFVPGIGVTQYIQNNGKARIWGLETELTVVPWEGGTLDANASFQNGKYEKGTFVETQVVAGSGCTNPAGVVNGCVVDLSGLPLIQLPKTQLNVGFSQKFQMELGTLTFRGSYSYVSSQVFNAVKAASQQPASVQAQYAAETALGRIPGYGLFNGRISFLLNNPNVEIAVFGRNIANNKYNVRSFSDLYRQLGIASEYAGDPGTYGAELTFKF